MKFKDNFSKITASLRFIMVCTINICLCEHLHWPKSSCHLPNLFTNVPSPNSQHLADLEWRFLYIVSLSRQMCCWNKPELLDYHVSLKNELARREERTLQGEPQLCPDLPAPVMGSAGRTPRPWRWAVGWEGKKEACMLLPIDKPTAISVLPKDGDS